MCRNCFYRKWNLILFIETFKFLKKNHLFLSEWRCIHLFLKTDCLCHGISNQWDVNLMSFGFVMNRLTFWSVRFCVTYAIMKAAEFTSSFLTCHYSPLIGHTGYVFFFFLDSYSTVTEAFQEGNWKWVRAGNSSYWQYGSTCTQRAHSFLFLFLQKYSLWHTAWLSTVLSSAKPLL